MKFNQQLRTKIGATIRRQRAKSGLSMYRVAMLTGMDAAQVRQIELGKPGLSIEALFLIAKAIKSSPAKLLGGLK